MLSSFFLLCSTFTIALAADCFNGNINSYTGNTEVTESGAKCVSWDDTGLTSSNMAEYRKGIIESDKTARLSKCRLPHPNLDKPWCYIGTPSNYERCIVPQCTTGCYKQGPGELDSDVINMADLTLGKCRDYCLKNGKLFASTRGGSTCSCGDSYGKHGPLFSEKCNSQCAGDKNETCGGPAALQVLPTGHICTVNNPCRYGGRCQPKKSLDASLRIGGDYTCGCRPGFEGKNCEKVKDCNADNYCKNGGTCVMSDTAQPFCKCTPEFQGKKSCSFCDEIQCRNGGTCRESALGTYKCQCPLEFTGEFCERSMDYCDPNPCQSGGKCTDYAFTYRCECKEGFAGDNCERVASTISKNLCYNVACQGKSPCLANKLQNKEEGFCDRGSGHCFIRKLERVGGGVTWQSGCSEACSEGSKQVDGIREETIQCCQSPKCNRDDFGMTLARLGASSVRATLTLVATIFSVFCAHFML